MIIDPRIVPDAHAGGLTLEEIADCCGCGVSWASKLLVKSGRKVRKRNCSTRDMTARRAIVRLFREGIVDEPELAAAVGRSKSFVRVFLRRWLNGVEVMGCSEMEF